MSSTINYVDVTSIKQHGSVMVVAWLFFGGLGHIIPRYMQSTIEKKVGGVGLWLVIHLLLVTMTMILVVAGLGIIIGNSGTTPLEGDLGANPHPVIGILSCIFLFMQPIIGIVRALAKDTFRWVMGWVHTVVGYLAFVLAISAIALAGWMPNVYATGNGEDGIEIYSFCGLLIACAVAYYVAHLILTEIDKIAEEREETEYEPDEKLEMGQNNDRMKKMITVGALALLILIFVSCLVYTIHNYDIIAAE